MSGQFRGAGGVDKLLKLAQAEMEARRVDLADIERARVAAEKALEELGEELAHERASGADSHALALYEGAMRERRFNLRKTLNSLETAGEQARERLQDALGEAAKLEHVVEMNRRADAAHARRRDARKAAETPLGRLRDHAAKAS